MYQQVYLLLIALVITLGTSCQFSTSDEKAQTVQKDKILFIVSNAGKYGNSTIDAANHFTEIVVPYHLLDSLGYSIDIVSPKGGNAPIGYIDSTDFIVMKYLEDVDFMNQLKSTLKPSDVQSKDYAAVVYGGGGSAMFGVPEDQTIQALSQAIYSEQKGIVAAICHGAAGLVNLKLPNGRYIYEGKKVNGYPDAFENMKADYYQTFPFSIEQLLKERGGDFRYSKTGWDGYWEVDGRLVTAQDPTAAHSFALAVHGAIQKTLASR